MTSGRNAVSRRIYFASLGCAKNQVDTEVMLGMTSAAGYRHVEDPSAAEVIVVNTCGFIDAAKEESIVTILELAEQKRDGACERLVVTGCLVQGYADELVREVPEIDVLLGSADFPQLLSAIEAGGVPGEATRIVSDAPSYLYDHDTPRVFSGARHSVFVKISEGCDRPCAFCAIPSLRGPLRSRSVDSVVRETERAVAAGAREINLVAQDSTRYGRDLPAPRPGLPDLLRAVARVDGLRWVRLHYAYPTGLTDDLLAVIAEEPTVVPYLDVPLQHVDDEVLRRMRRGHGARLARELVSRVRARIDGVVLRTTFLVGHPGESEEAFERLADFVAEARFDRVGVFTYSGQAGTVSAMLPHRVPAEVAEHRRERLLLLQQGISEAKNRELVGSELEVLVDGPSEESELVLAGRWYGQAPEVDGAVYLEEGLARAGDFVRARVTQASAYDLVAAVLPAAGSEA